MIIKHTAGRISARTQKTHRVLSRVGCVLLFNTEGGENLARRSVLVRKNGYAKNVEAVRRTEIKIGTTRQPAREAYPLKMYALRRSIARPATLRVAHFSSTPLARESVIDKAKAAADKVNKSVGQAAAAGLDKVSGESNAEGAKANAKSAGSTISDAASDVTSQAKAEAKKVGADAQKMKEDAQRKMS
ncbi:uncharacterized protein L969DRAFT_93376 [Mixia osmundae IAM 14324]|uniref:Uncharacterized protein n=1 Tax=Mixia osmundae (strain CBS 9802 / IAM 14324 / JCM 22182 / KY 12970) TaxID=764103 RepID=G7E594_MIXOS|nr:uncharacterized protein L969DRAFT_93376 [Mixia osmundae IAM 14324]KEI40846.1 hypothetical protein L969DRAFT_93376 [Mixia osmundae IAM 14324]GAA98004.1 hypothetical protein E5Q_04684 [Mixia osmundae IAM 14324]